MRVRMCGRYGLTKAEPGELDERLRLPVPPNSGPRYNIAPTEEVLVVAAKDGERRTEMMRWGLVASWSTKIEGPLMINARMEDVQQRAAYRRLIPRADRRCLLIADGYYEWLKPEQRGRPRQPFWFTVDGGRVFAFPGLWTPAKVEGEWLHSCSLLTCNPDGNHVAAAIHDRMPVIFADEEQWDAWLSADVDARAALELCGPLAESRLSSRPANPAVNKAGVEGPELLVA